jgi:hypothetical protein
MIWRVLYPEVYFPNYTDAVRDANRIHSQHCLDRLRETVMCGGDTTMFTYRFGTHQPIPIGNFTTPHECANWDAIQDYAKARSVDMFEPGLIVHPTLGPAYAHIAEADGTGTVHDVVCEEHVAKGDQGCPNKATAQGHQHAWE